MQVGDLVKYGDGKPNGHIGIVVGVHRNNVIAVLWANGYETNHSSGWLVLLKESA